MKYFLMLLLAFLGCRKDEHPAQPTGTATDDLASRYALYHSLAPRGWGEEQHCDALEFVSLLHVGLREAGPVDLAQREPGRWFRLPQPDYAASCSSDISRDMLIGLMSYLWQFRRLDWAEDLFQYGKRNNWKMGNERKDFDNRTILTPNLIGMLARIIHAMGGKDHPERHFPTAYDTSPGFVSHLTMQQIRIEGAIRGSISETELEVLKSIRQHMPSNPLAHMLIHKYTDGDQSEATRLLLAIWPADRLPTGDDWCERWRIQRSDGDTGFEPCPAEGRHHTGGDFLLVARDILDAAE